MGEQKISYTDEEIFEKLKGILEICCPDLDVNTVKPDSVINRDLGIDSLNFVMIMVKVEAAFDIRVEDEEWDHLHTAQDVIDKVKEELAKKAEA